VACSVAVVAPAACQRLCLRFNGGIRAELSPAQQASLPPAHMASGCNRSRPTARGCRLHNSGPPLLHGPQPSANHAGRHTTAFVTVAHGAQNPHQAASATSSQRPSPAAPPPCTPPNAPWRTNRRNSTVPRRQRSAAAAPRARACRTRRTPAAAAAVLRAAPRACGPSVYAGAALPQHLLPSAKGTVVRREGLSRPPQPIGARSQRHAARTQREGEQFTMWRFCAFWRSCPP
jgi:hypothetical protein